MVEFYDVWKCNFVWDKIIMSEREELRVKIKKLKYKIEK